MKTRVLLIGKTGVGKSSIAKALLGADPRPNHDPQTEDDYVKVVDEVTGEEKKVLLNVNDGAKGVTFTCTTYHGANGFIVTDTVGFGEGEQGTVASIDALRQLRKLLRASIHGYHLILYVITAGRTTTATDQAIFEMFADILMPDLRDNMRLIVTRCDSNENWVKENMKIIKLSLRGRLGENPPVQGVSFPFIKSIEECSDSEEAEEDEKRYKKKRDRNVARLLAFIENNSAELKVPQTAKAEEDDWLVARIFRLILHKLGLNNLKDSLYEILRALGWKPDDIERIIQEDLTATIAAVGYGAVVAVADAISSAVNWASSFFSE